METDITKPYTYLEAVAEQLRTQYKGHTYAEVAELTGVSKSMIELVMGPRMQNLTLDTLIRLVGPTGLDITSFFELIEYPDPDSEPAPPRRNTGNHGKNYTLMQKVRAVGMVRVDRLTYAQAAERVGCHRTTVSRWVKEADPSDPFYGFE